MLPVCKDGTRRDNRECFKPVVSVDVSASLAGIFYPALIATCKSVLKNIRTLVDLRTYFRFYGLA